MMSFKSFMQTQVCEASGLWPRRIIALLPTGWWCRSANNRIRRILPVPGLWICVHFLRIQLLFQCRSGSRLKIFVTNNLMKSFLELKKTKRKFKSKKKNQGAGPNLLNFCIIKLQIYNTTNFLAFLCFFLQIFPS